MLHLQVHGRLALRWFGVLGLVATLAMGVFAMPVAAQTTSGWSPGPWAAGDNTFDGYIDWPVGGSSVASNIASHVNGWIVDKSVAGSAGIDDVHVYDGVAGAGGTFLGRGTVAQNRPDVGMVLGNMNWANSGFWFDLPANTLQVGPHTLTVYAHTPTRGWWYKQVSVNVVRGTFDKDPLTAVTAPTLHEEVPTSKEYTIIGYSLDRNASKAQKTGVDRVEVWVNGERDSPGATYIGTADLGYESGPAAEYGSQFANAGWQLTFRPTMLHAENYFLYVYAHSTVTGKDSLTAQAQEFRIVEQ